MKHRFGVHIAAAASSESPGLRGGFCIRIGLALAVVISGAASGAARKAWHIDTRVPSFSSFWNLAAGSAADYEVQRQCGASTIELAVVGRDRLDGKDGYWTEISGQEAKSHEQMVFKTFFSLDSKGIDFTRMIVQTDNGQPVELPWDFDFLAKGYLKIAVGYRVTYFGPLSEYYPVGTASDLGPETITTPAGTFSSEHFRYEHDSGDVWVAREAAPFGLVKAVTRDQTTMTLTRLLTDMKGKITALPRPYDGKKDKHLAGKFRGLSWYGDVDPQRTNSETPVSGVGEKQVPMWDILNCAQD